MKQSINELPPMFSIVTVVFNDCEGLEATFSSISTQLYENYEWVVIDGGSSDGSVQYIKEVVRPGDMLLSERDNGIYDAMNKGMRLAKGKYLVFMNAGDRFYSNDSLKRVYDLLNESNYAADILFGGACLKFGNGRTWYRQPKSVGRYIWHGLSANHQATYYSNKRLGGQNYDLKYSLCGDYYLLASLFKNGIKPVYLNEPIVEFRVGDTSYTNPLKLVSEAYQIQRDILHTSIVARLISAAKRIAAILVTIAIANLPPALLIYKQRNG